MKRTRWMWTRIEELMEGEEKKEWQSRNLNQQNISSAELLFSMLVHLYDYRHEGDPLALNVSTSTSRVCPSSALRLTESRSPQRLGREERHISQL
ncbi:hypothetical protein AOLI_G00014160 [Acnodon oligacanthus]